MMNNFLILDFGNTRIKVFSGKTRSLDQYYYSNVNELIDYIQSYNIQKIYYSTVIPAQSSLFVNCILV